MFDKITSLWARLWEILSSIKDLSWDRLLLLAAGLVLILMFGRRLSGLRWLRNQEEQERAYQLVIKRAKHNLASIGDCMCPGVLPDIELRLANESKPNLTYTRILSEQQPSPIVVESLNKLMNLCEVLHKNPTGPQPRLLVGRSKQVGDVRVCLNEETVIVAVPLKFVYDGEWLFFEIHHTFLSDHILKGVRHFYENHCRKIQSCRQLVHADEVHV